MTFDDYMAKLKELGGLASFEQWLSENNLHDAFEASLKERQTVDTLEHVANGGEAEDARLAGLIRAELKDGKSVEEIAELLSIPTGEVYRLM